MPRWIFSSVNLTTFRRKVILCAYIVYVDSVDSFKKRQQFMILTLNTMSVVRAIQQISDISVSVYGIVNKIAMISNK